MVEVEQEGRICRRGCRDNHSTVTEQEGNGSRTEELRWWEGFGTCSKAITVTNYPYRDKFFPMHIHALAQQRTSATGTHHTPPKGQQDGYYLSHSTWAEQNSAARFNQKPKSCQLMVTRHIPSPSCESQPQQYAIRPKPESNLTGWTEIGPMAATWL